jgi:flagellar biosynthesis protein FliR
VTDFAGLSGDVILNHAFALVLVLARVGATLVYLPGLGETTIPATVKAGMVLTLTILLLPIVEPLLPQRPASEVALGLLVMTELANGLWFGWLARVLTNALPLAGQFIADFAGLANVLLPNPELGAQTTAISSLYDIAVPALILSTGLYTELISALVGFYQLIPPGTMAWVPDSTAKTVSVVAQSFDLALRLAAPFILVAIAWHVAIGLIARLVPRLQIFFVAMPGQIAVGLLLLGALAAPTIGAWIEAMHAGFGGLPGS